MGLTASPSLFCTRGVDRVTGVLAEAFGDPPLEPVELLTSLAPAIQGAAPLLSYPEAPEPSTEQLATG